MSGVGIDRLVRKEVALGAIRERPWPQEHIGLAQIAPFMDVATDDVIFDYIKGGYSDGLAPARAEDAEAELAQKDEALAGQGRAAVVDWSLKDKYTASDVTRYREDLLLQQAASGLSTSLNLNFTGRTIEDFQRRLAVHDALRRRKLDNRLEWLIMQAIETGGIAYNDGKIKFTVNYGRPANQQNQAPASGLWNTANFDPIGDITAVGDFMFDTYGVRPKRAYTSKRVLDAIWKSNRFVQVAGIVVGGAPSSPIDPRYLTNGVGRDAAIEIVQRETGVRFIEYDSVYRTRALGTNTWVNNRFLSDNKIFYLPEEGDLGEVDDTMIGFAKTLTSPHPEGNWASGYYEWEDETKDPWMHVRGSGVKAFPVFPYMEYTFTQTVL